MTIEIRILPKKKFEGSGGSGYHFTEGDKHIVEVPKGVSTRTRLHEIGHCELDHRTGDMSYNELAKREIDAEVFAYRAMGKVPSWKVAIPFLNELILDYNMDVNNAFNITIRALENAGIKVNKNSRSDIWSICTGLHMSRVSENTGDFNESIARRYVDALDR